MTKFWNGWMCRSLIFLIGLVMESVQEDKDGEGIRNENCNQIFMAQTLYNRMFPSTRIWEEVAIIKPMKNSTCSYTVSNGICTIMSNSKGVLVKVNNINNNLHIETAVPQICSQIPDKPRNLLTNITSLVIQNTNVVSIQENAFRSWPNLQKLKIFNNDYLTDIQPGAFKGLENVWKLEIMDNVKLSCLHEESLKGLKQLRGLFLQRNSITHIQNISKALNPKYLPILLHLDLTGNKILHIGQYDFLPMKGGLLYTLIIGLTKTNYIHPQALDPFGNSLVSLGLSELNVNSTNLIEFINRTTHVNMNLKYISMEQNLLCGFPKDLLNVMSNITVGLNIGKNHFGQMQPGSFPVMHKLKYLDISEVLLDEIPEGVINSTVFPHLSHLYLTNNKFTELTLSMVTPTITRLTMNKASLGLNDLDLGQMDSNFQIDDGVLKSMPNLQLLDLSGNNLLFVKRDTFKDAKILSVLLLRRTSLNYIDSGSFQFNRQLYYLDLSFNMFPIVIRQKGEPLGNIFFGLDNLLALDISYCNIDSIDKTTFMYLDKLQYLSVQGNPIFKPGPNTFMFVPHLKVVDLRNNILTSWENSIFTDQQSLNSLMLSYNNILTLTEAMLNDFKKVRDVDLYANSISCDCDLLNNVQNAYLDWNNSLFVGKTKCSYPTNTSLVGYINSHILACVSYTKAIIACSCMSLIIVILILTVLYFKYKYEIQYRFLMFKKKLGIVNTYRAKKCSVNVGYFQYDAFVSYSAHDSSFVEKMRMILEKDGSKFRLCVFERDFNPGDNLVDKIIECMEVSMVTILVLTESFAKSEWCRWEMSIAQNKTISQRFLKDSLIIILKSHVEESLMTPTLKYLMDTRVYLEWHEHSSVRQNIFWEKLKDALKERTQIKLPVPDTCDSNNSSIRKRTIFETDEV